jgi:proteasome lid subunit RPN8/RPN11
MQTQDKDKTKEQKPQENKNAVNKVPDWPVGLSMANNEKLMVSVDQDLAVVLTKDAFEQLFGWAYSTSKEISCLGSVRRSGNRFFIDRFYLLKQSGSWAGTEIDQDSIAELMERLIAEGKTEEARRIKCWAHSHPNMEVFWSNTDNDTCKLLVSDYLISIVAANNFAVRCRIDIARPVPVTFDNVPVFYEMPKDTMPMEKYAEQVKNTVSQMVFTFTGKDQDQTEQEQQQGQYVPTYYCDCCGYVHADGECPLAGDENWPNVDEDLPF